MTTDSAALEKSKGLHIALWIVQVVLAAMFGMGGVMKMTTPIAELAQTVDWAGALPPLLVRFIGVAELAAHSASSCRQPRESDPGLTPLAAVGLATIMILAMMFHASRGELQALPINLGLGGLAAFVAWGRSKKVPIIPKP